MPDENELERFIERAVLEDSASHSPGWFECGGDACDIPELTEVVRHDQGDGSARTV